MAAKWWRYNSTSHIFEQSLNEGDTWTKPPLDASIITEGVFDPARLPAAVGNYAYTDVANIFTKKQTISTPTTYPGLQIEHPSYGMIHLKSTAGIVDKKLWRLYSNASDGSFNINLLNDAENALIESEVIIQSSLRLRSNVAIMWFNSQSTPADQKLFRLAYYAGGLQFEKFNDAGAYASTPVSFGIDGKINDMARGNGIGFWFQHAIGNGSVWGNVAGITLTTANNYYMLIGKTCFMIVNMDFNSGANNYIYFHLPIAALKGGQMSILTSIHPTAANQKFVYTITTAGQPYMTCVPLQNLVFNAGQQQLYGMFFYEIA